MGSGGLFQANIGFPYVLSPAIFSELQKSSDSSLSPSVLQSLFSRSGQVIRSSVETGDGGTGSVVLVS